MDVIHGYGVLNMTSLQQNIDSSIRVLRSLAMNIENSIIRGEADRKTMSVASRIVQLVGRVAEALETLVRKLPESQGGVIELVNYSYLVKSPTGFILVKTRPEHIVLTYDDNKRTLSLKSRIGSMTISTNSINISSRGLVIDISPITIEKLSSNRDELRILLKHFEKIVYNRLVPLVEQRIVKR